MNEKELKQIEKIKKGYTQKETSKLEELKSLDKRAKKPALIFAYIFGVIGSLVLGTGMCFAMNVIGNSMVLGIIIGVIGIAMVGVNYYIYKAMLVAGKNKYSERILNLSNEILNENR